MKGNKKKPKQTNTKPNGFVKTRWAIQAHWASCIRISNDRLLS